MVDSAIGDPDPILLVDAEVKWRLKGLARLCAVTLANNLALGQIYREFSASVRDAI
jgi:hypothetical protein